MIMVRACVLVGLAAACGGCASTIGAVPKPFPMPGDSHPEVRAPNPAASPLTAVVETALELRGTPYRNGGSDPSGFDCSGFTQYVFAQYGVALPREGREQYQQGVAVDVSELAPGDLVFFTSADPGASHVAIVIGGDQLLRAPAASGVVRVGHLGASYWTHRYLGARRVS